MTVMVIAELTPVPGQGEVLRRAVQTLTVASRAEEGCLSYRPLLDPARPGTIVILETWRDAEALASHSKTEAMAQFKAAIKGAEVVVTRHRISAA